MDRRLHNNLTALAVSGAVLVVALVSASPLPATGPAPLASAEDAGPASTLLAALERAGAPVEAAIDAGSDDTSATGRSGATGVRQIHRRTAMPYFTFLPRG